MLVEILRNLAAVIELEYLMKQELGRRGLSALQCCAMQHCLCCLLNSMSQLSG